MKVTNLLLICILSISIYPQQNSILEKQKNKYKNDSRESYKVMTQLKRTNYQILKPLQSLNTSGLVDTLSYNDGTFNTEIPVTGQEWLLQWYQAPTDLRIMALGFYCTTNPDDLPAEVKLVNVNWVSEQLLSAGTEWWGYYEALGNGYNDITAFLDNPDRTGGWTSIQQGVTEPFGEDLWSDGGVGFSFVPNETLQDYQWIRMDLFQPSVLAGEIFGVALKNPYPIIGEGTMSFLAGIIGVPGWKFYPNGRNNPGLDYGWWTTEYTFDFAAVVDLVGNPGPVIEEFTHLATTISTQDRIVDAIVSDDSPANVSGVAYVYIYYSTDAGLSWDYTEMTGIEPNYTGFIPGQPPGTEVAYYLEASDVWANITQSQTLEYMIFAPSDAQTLVIFNGFDNITGYPQDYYFGPDIQSGLSVFPHDSWSYGALTSEIVDHYDNIFEFSTTGPKDYNDSVITNWLAAHGTRNYFLAGQEWLGARYGFTDMDFAAGSFEFDILGINHSYNDVSFDGTNGQNIPSLVMPVAGMLFGGPLEDLFNSLNPPADSMMYNPGYEIGMANWIDAFDVEADVVVEMNVETRGIEGVPDVQILPTMARRTLPAGNKIVFVAYDPISLNTANNSNFPYYFWVGFDEANSPYQTLDWFVNIIADDVRESNGVTPTEFLLSQNYPNPFNPSTRIKYALSSLPTGQAGRQFVSLKVYDVLGNEVATLVNEEKPAGEYEVEFNSASSIKYPASGVYFYQLKAGDFIQTKKMLLIK